MRVLDTVQAKRERVFGLDFARCICTIIIVLFHYVSLGEHIKKCGLVNTAVSWISKLSFPIFLFHHKVILDVQGVNNPTDISGEIFVILAAFLLIIIFSMILSVVDDALLRSKLFICLERRITKY